MGRSRLRALRPQAVVAIVERNGFAFVRSGPHGDLYRRASDQRYTTVPRAGGKKAGKGGGRRLGPPMIELIRKQTGKSESELAQP
jgi:predicted RNA binding protein YcfA (HicA-like mRNA interferase family)